MGEFVVTTDSDLTILLKNRHIWGCPFGQSNGCDVDIFETFQISINLGRERVWHWTNTTKRVLCICIHLKLSLDSLDEPKFILEHGGVMVNDLLVS